MIRSVPRNDRTARRRIAALVALCLVWMILGELASPVWAAQDTVLTLPTGRRPPPSGLRMTVDASWVEGCGYRPVQVTIASVAPGPLPADRSLSIELRSDGMYGRGETRVGQTIELPEGTVGPWTTTVLVPGGEWSQLDVMIWEDGQVIEELLGGIGNTFQEHYSEAAPKMLIVSSSVGRSGATSRQRIPDVRALSAVSHAGPRVAIEATVSNSAIVGYLQIEPYEHLASPTDLPQRWLGLTSVDLLFISMDDLEMLAADYPRRFEAVRQWTEAGGNLCVWAIGARFERLGTLERRFQLPSLPADDGDDRILRGWHTPEPALLGNPTAAIEAMRKSRSRKRSYGRAAFDVDDESIEDSAPVPEASWPPPLVWREHSGGAVVALAADDPFPGDQFLWCWLLDTLGRQRWTWYQRHGMSLSSDNPGYWNFLIPGVGLAPINAFRILITLFVLLIGPLNYFVLRRLRRLHLMLITVPVAAVAVTSGMLIWAVASDGLSVRTRLRSFSRIDQRTGRSVTWSRQTYYSALTPSGGLVFPPDAAVYPLDSMPAGDRARSRHRMLRWDDRQRLRAGYVQPRIASQFMTIQPAQSDLRLEVAGGTDDAPVRVTNRLGSDAVVLLLRDRAGDYHWGESIADGTAATLAPVRLVDAALRLAERFDLHRPTLPAEFNPDQFRSAMNRLGGWRRRYYSSQFEVSPSPRTSLQERNLARFTVADPEMLAAGSYVAVVVADPHVAVALPNTRREACFHVIEGVW